MSVPHCKFLFSVSTLHHCSDLEQDKIQKLLKECHKQHIPSSRTKTMSQFGLLVTRENVLYEQKSQHNILQSCQAERRKGLDAGRIFVKVSFEDSSRLLLVLSLQSYFSTWLLVVNFQLAPFNRRRWDPAILNQMLLDFKCVFFQPRSI